MDSKAIHLVPELDPQAIASFCERWMIAELALFGSVLRDDFGPDSDIDVLVTFRPGEQWSLMDLVTMREELIRLFGRPVDLVEKRSLRNPFRRRHILDHHRVIYAAA